VSFFSFFPHCVKDETWHLTTELLTIFFLCRCSPPHILCSSPTCTTVFRLVSTAGGFMPFMVGKRGELLALLSALGRGRLEEGLLYDSGVSATVMTVVAEMISDTKEGDVWGMNGVRAMVEMSRAVDNYFDSSEAVKALMKQIEAAESAQSANISLAHQLAPIEAALVRFFADEKSELPAEFIRAQMARTQRGKERFAFTNLRRLVRFMIGFHVAFSIIPDSEYETVADFISTRVVGYTFMNPARHATSALYLCAPDRVSSIIRSAVDDARECLTALNSRAAATASTLVSGSVYELSTEEGRGLDDIVDALNAVDRSRAAWFGPDTLMVSKVRDMTSAAPPPIQQLPKNIDCLYMSVIVSCKRGGAGYMIRDGVSAALELRVPLVLTSLLRVGYIPMFAYLRCGFYPVFTTSSGASGGGSSTARDTTLMMVHRDTLPDSVHDCYPGKFTTAPPPAPSSSSAAVSPSNLAVEPSKLLPPGRHVLFTLTSSLSSSRVPIFSPQSRVFSIGTNREGSYSLSTPSYTINDCDGHRRTLLTDVDLLFCTLLRHYVDTSFDAAHLIKQFTSNAPEKKLVTVVRRSHGFAGAPKRQRPVDGTVLRQLASDLSDKVLYPIPGKRVRAAHPAPLLPPPPPPPAPVPTPPASSFWGGGIEEKLAQSLETLQRVKAERDKANAAYDAAKAAHQQLMSSLVDLVDRVKHASSAFMN
jgi:hypothetical protein